MGRSPNGSSSLAPVALALETEAQRPGQACAGRKLQMKNPSPPLLASRPGSATHLLCDWSRTFDHCASPAQPVCK